MSVRSLDCLARLNVAEVRPRRGRRQKVLPPFAPAAFRWSRRPPRAESLPPAAAAAAGDAAAGVARSPGSSLRPPGAAGCADRAAASRGLSRRSPQPSGAGLRVLHGLPTLATPGSGTAAPSECPAGSFLLFAVRLGRLCLFVSVLVSLVFEFDVVGRG